MKRKYRIFLALGLVLAMVLTCSQAALARTIYSEPLQIDGQLPADQTALPEETPAGEIAPDATPETSEEPGLETELPLGTPDPEAEQPAFDLYTATVSAPEGASVYELPTVVSRVVANLLAGDRVSVRGLFGGWARIDVEGLEGFVDASLLSDDAPEPTPELTPEPTLEPTLEPTPEPTPEPVSAHLTLDVPAEPKLGDQVTLNCVVSGDAENLQVVWQRAQTDSDGAIIDDWRDVEGEGLSHSLTLTPESILTAWRVRISVADGEQ